MGNIPLAAVLFSNGVSYAGIMAFIFSDLVVFPVLRIQAKYYGWKMALYIMAVFVVILVIASMLLHYGFALFDLLPDDSQVQKLSERSFFEIDYGFYLNCIFLIVSLAFFSWHLLKRSKKQHVKKSLMESILFFFACVAFVWLFIGLLI